MRDERICIVPKVHGGGGGDGFVFAKFSAQALALGVQTTFDLKDAPTARCS